MLLSYSACTIRQSNTLPRDIVLWYNTMLHWCPRWNIWNISVFLTIRTRMKKFFFQCLARMSISADFTGLFSQVPLVRVDSHSSETVWMYFVVLFVAAINDFKPTCNRFNKCSCRSSHSVAMWKWPNDSITYNIMTSLLVTFLRCIHR